MAEIPFSSQKIIGNYILDRIIGSGQYGIIYLAKCLSLNQENNTAIKQIAKRHLNSQNMQRFQEETKNLLEISSHINMVQIFEMIQSTRNHYIVMQYCNGGNLRSYFEYSSKRIQESIFQPLAAQIVIGLKFLVQKQIIHRDIKPENILLHIQEYQLIKLAGFGFSKYLEKGKMAETMCGTPLYSSPEILKEEKYDFKADVWSFGVIMYEMLTGHLPYEANSIQEIQEKFKVQLPWNILEISQSAKDLLQRILVINQNDRLDIFQV